MKVTNSAECQTWRARRDVSLEQHHGAAGTCGRTTGSEEADRTQAEDMNDSLIPDPWGMVTPMEDSPSLWPEKQYLTYPAVI